MLKKFNYICFENVLLNAFSLGIVVYDETANECFSKRLVAIMKTMFRRKFGKYNHLTKIYVPENTYLTVMELDSMSDVDINLTNDNVKVFGVRFEKDFCNITEWYNRQQENIVPRGCHTIVLGIDNDFHGILGAF